MLKYFLLSLSFILVSQSINPSHSGDVPKQTSAARQTSAAKTVSTDETFSGYYKITASKKFPTDERTVIVHLKRKRDKVELVDIARDDKLVGDVVKDKKGESVVFKFDEQMYQNVAAIKFRHVWSSDQKTATAELTSGQTVTLQVEPVLSVWACDNHKNPTHTADSEARIKELTAKNGCAGWHKLEPDE